MKKYPWETDSEQEPKQTKPRYVPPPPWYKNEAKLKPIMDWTDEELEKEHEIVRARIFAARLEEHGKV